MMTRRAFSAGVLGGVAALSLSGCGFTTDVDEMDFLWGPPYRAKLTVTVATPEGPRSGHSVIEVTYDKSGVGYKVRGQAVAVDLPGGHTLFALLRSETRTSVDWPADLHRNVKAAIPYDENNPSAFYAAIARDRGVWPLRRRQVSAVEDSDNYPIMVRFTNPADPRTVEQVDPDDLAAAFGPGVALSAITVQMTDEPVTRGIERRLVWWNNYIGKHFDGPSTVSEDMQTSNLAARLSPGSFSTELAR